LKLRNAFSASPV